MKGIRGPDGGRKMDPDGGRSKTKMAEISWNLGAVSFNASNDRNFTLAHNFGT